MQDRECRSMKIEPSNEKIVDKEPNFQAASPNRLKEKLTSPVPSNNEKCKV